MVVRKKAKAKPKAKARPKAEARPKARPRPKAKAKPKAKPRTKATTKRAKATTGKAWTAAEIKNLRQGYKTKPASKMAKELKRTLASVRGKISVLGLRKTPVRKAKPKAKKRTRR